MRVDDGGDVILVRNLLDESVNHERRLGVETRVWFIAEEVFGIEHNGAGNGGAFLHTSAYLRRVKVDGTCEVHTLKTLACPLLNFVLWSFGKHLRGNITFSSTVRGVEQRRALKQHANLAVHVLLLVVLHLGDVAPIVQNGAGVYCVCPPRFSSAPFCPSRSGQ